MQPVTRKQFLQRSAIMLAAVVAGPSVGDKKQPPLLSFSTLGCPDWTFEQLTDFAALHQYQGIELRGILRQLDLTKCPEFSTAANITATLSRMKQKGLKFADLGSSANLHVADPVKRKENLDEARRFIDLAHQLGCPFVRVFPNNLPPGQDKQVTLDLISAGLRELGTYATGTGVQVLMETHGDLVHTNDLLTVMQSVNQPNTGLIWDVTNMWSITKEPPPQVYNALKKYIRHTHIKDGKLVNADVQYTFLGKGEVPIFEAIDLLRKGGYQGYYSFEWEKMWHPEIAAPELALADYPVAMKEHFASS